MSSFIYLLTKTKLLFLVIGIGILLLVMISLSFSGNQEASPSPRPSPTILRGIPDLPEAQPQQFLNQNSSQLGTLAVTANTGEVSVTIDSEEVNSPNFFAPENKTPFLMSQIPSGSHILRASKLGFLNQEITIEVKPGEINEVTLDMKPDPAFNSLQEATKQMPVSTDEYLIEYLDKIGKIQVIVRKAPFETYKQSAISWFKQRGIENPEQSGVLFYPAMNIY